VLDRAITYGSDLYDALKIGLVSVDSTMRSNLSVGLPLDCLVARRDDCDAELNTASSRGALFPRPAGALVGSAAGAHCQYPTPALQDGSLSTVR
jgi:putative proteasome-type protease